MCVSTRLADYPCGEKDKGQSKVTMEDETSSACMDSAQIISYNMLGFPVCVSFHECFSVCFIISRPGDRWCVGFKEGKWDSLLEENTPKDIVIIFTLG